MDDFTFELPEELIAQTPLARRSASRLMVLDRDSQSIEQRQFSDLPQFLNRGDLLVMNNSKVLPARLTGNRQSGGAVEFLLLREIEPRRWCCLMRPARRLRIGESIAILPHSDKDLAPGRVTVREHLDDGEGVIELDETIAANLADFGRVPLPPYIREFLDDDNRYQTVYASSPGSAAAPTAGLHFDQATFAALEEGGVGVAHVTLHVGLDTFRPVTSEFAEDHVIHREWCEVPRATAQAIAETRARGNRVIAVGTTSARTLESFGATADPDAGMPFESMTGIYITPGFEWKVVDAMITNFHLPRSSLLLMLSSFAGTEFLRFAYQEAIAARYRFFSFGDAMLVR